MVNMQRWLCTVVRVIKMAELLWETRFLYTCISIGLHDENGTERKQTQKWQCFNIKLYFIWTWLEQGVLAQNTALYIIVKFVST